MPRVKQERDVAKARSLRANMSLPEVLLWRKLRQQDEVRFRRQHPVGRYVLDFYCAEAKVCVEVDGLVHATGDRAAHDVERDGWLCGQGITVMRIAGADVLRSPADTAEALVRHCRR